MMRYMTTIPSRMKRLIFGMALSCMLTGVGQRVHAADVQVLVVGDSWSRFVWDFKVLREMFDDFGLNLIEECCSSTTINGSTAAQWNTPEKLLLITNALAANPDMDTALVFLGGNDLRADWSTSLTPEQSAQLTQTILANINSVVNHILVQRPSMDVVLVGYDYPNFVESLASSALCDPTFEEMGSPTTLQMNESLVLFEAARAQLAEGRDNVHYVSSLGVGQFLYGYAPGNLNPYAIAPPGNVNFPSPPQIMETAIGSIIDCIHYDSDGYDFLAYKLFDEFFNDKYNAGHVINFVNPAHNYNPNSGFLEMGMGAVDSLFGPVTLGQVQWKLIRNETPVASGLLNFSAGPSRWSGTADLGVLPGGMYDVEFHVLSNFMQTEIYSGTFEVQAPPAEQVLMFLLGLGGQAIDLNSDFAVDIADPITEFLNP